MESSLSKEIKVGIFTLTGIILFCISVILLGGDKWFLTKTYELKVQLPQVQGLGTGSVVSVAGVPVGNVKSIDFVDGTRDIQVTMNIDYDVKSRITQGSVVSVKTQGALGDKYIYIEPGPMDAPVIPAGSLLETDRKPDFLDIIAAKGAEMGEVVNVVKEVRILLENLNRDHRSAKLVENLVAASGEFTLLMAEARQSLKPMYSVMKKIDSGHGTLGALVNDPTLHNRLSTFLGEAPRNRFLKPLIRDSIQTNEKN